jgi:glycogen synthase
MGSFLFTKYKPEVLVQTIKEAVDLCDEPKAWRKIMANGMVADSSWDRSAIGSLESVHPLLMR